MRELYYEAIEGLDHPQTDGRTGQAEVLRCGVVMRVCASALTRAGTDSCTSAVPHGFEPSHLARRFVGNLGPVVLPAVLPVSHTRQYFLASGAVAGQLVGYDQARDVRKPFSSFRKKRVAALLSRRFCTRISSTSPSWSDSPRQVAPLSVDRDENFVEEPGVARTALAPTQGSGVRPAELETPLPDRLVADNDAALSQEIFHIPKTEARAVIEPHGVSDELPRIAVAGIGIRR